MTPEYLCISLKNLKLSFQKSCLNDTFKFCHTLLLLQMPNSIQTSVIRIIKSVAVYGAAAYNESSLAPRKELVSITQGLVWQDFFQHYPLSVHWVIKRPVDYFCAYWLLCSFAITSSEVLGNQWNCSTQLLGVQLEGREIVWSVCIVERRYVW